MKILKISKTCLKIFMILSLFITVPMGVSAQENQGGVNSGFFGLILQGDIGYGKTAYGLIDGSSSSAFGEGNGSGIGLNAMLNLSIFAAKLQYNYATFDKMEFTYSGLKYETEGDGYYSTLDALVGVKLFTEQNDMGYTFFYGGFRYWRAVRNVTKTTIEGIDAGMTSETDLKGQGWIVGYQDLSTFPLGIFSLAFQSSIWLDSAPVKTIDGQNFDVQDKKALGGGCNFGIGVAFEDLGIVVLAGYKFDITATSFKDSGTEMITGAGHGLGYISAAIEF